MWPLLILIVCLTALPAGAAQDVEGQEAAGSVVTASVELDGQALFEVRGVSSLPAAERARRIHDQLKAVAADWAISIDTIRVVERGGASQIQAGRRIIMAVVDADARMEGVERPTLAQTHLLRIKQAVETYRAARTAASLRRSTAKATAATVLLVIVMLALSWGRRRIDRVLTERLRTRLQDARPGRFRAISAGKIWEALRASLSALHTLIFLGVVLAYLGFALAQFPWTRGLSGGMVDFALAPVEIITTGLVSNIPSLVFLIVLFLVFRLALRLIHLFFNAVERGAVTLANFDPDWAQPTYKLVRIGLIAFGLIVAFPYIPGSHTPAFQGISLFVGVVFSLGSSSSISNVIAGYMLIYRRAFKAGDLIKVRDYFGIVLGTRLQATHLRSMKNEELVIPNSEMLSAEITNYSSLARLHGLILHTEVGIGYDVPWRQVEAMLIEAARRTSDLGTEPRPYILEKRLGEFAVIYELNVYCTNVLKMRKLYAELHRNVLDVFNEYGVQIMTPKYENDPSARKVVPKNDWYAAPARNEP